MEFVKKQSQNTGVVIEEEVRYTTTTVENIQRKSFFYEKKVSFTIQKKSPA